MKAIVILLLFVNSTVFAQSKINRTEYINLLNAGKYDEVFSKAQDARNKTYGKNAVIDYFIAKSICLKGLTEAGLSNSEKEKLGEKSIEWLNYIDDNYPLNTEQRRFIKREKDSCIPQINRGIVYANFNYINYAPLPETEVQGKGGFTMGCDENENIIPANIKSIQELEERIFEIKNKKLAQEKIKSILSNNYNVDTSGRFIVVSYKSKGYKYSHIQQVTQKLENAYNFFLKVYEMKPSDKLITIYLVPDRQSLQNTSKIIHGINIPSNSIGYSSLSDLSLIGIGNPGRIGTLYHELFHLTIRNEVGDIPAWLDEGIACMYAVYKLNNDELFGAPKTWRVNHFKLISLMADEDIKIPTLEQLISMNWQEFGGGENRNTCRSSLNYSLSNMFLLFLQEKELVYPMVKAFKNRRTSKQEPYSPGLDDVELVTKVYNNDIKKISEDFYAWLNKTYNINMVKLINDRPYYNGYLPKNILELDESIDDLLVKIAKENLLDTDNIAKLRDEQRYLINRYSAKLEFLIKSNSKIITNVSRVVPDQEVNSETNIDFQEEELRKLENSLVNIKKRLLDLLDNKK